MNFINCGGNASPELLKKTVVFWCENSIQHINSLVKSPTGTTAVLTPFFKEQLKNIFQTFLEISDFLKQGKMNNTVYYRFLNANQDFINLLERIKYEAFSGYPVLQQSVFHYIYEQRYVNTVLAVKNNVGNVLVTAFFTPFSNQALNCFYNQMYFWGIIGSMHPSLLMGNNAFYNATNGYAKEFLTQVCNSFNKLNFELSSLKKPLKKRDLQPIFDEFYHLNLSYLEFLMLIKQGSVKIFSAAVSVRFSADFYTAVDHQIAEHTLVCEINQNIEKMLK